jgi:hypothetical protein
VTVTAVKAEDRRMLAERLIESFTDFWQSIKRSLAFSDHSPASIDYAVIVSNSYEVTDDQRQPETESGRMMGVPICRAVWLQQHGYRDIERRGRISITLCDVLGTHLTLTKITGGIRSWPQFNHDRDDVNEPQSNTDVLAMWGTQSYLEARGKALPVKRGCSVVRLKCHQRQPRAKTETSC